MILLWEDGRHESSESRQLCLPNLPIRFRLEAIFGAGLSGADQVLRPIRRE